VTFQYTYIEMLTASVRSLRFILLHEDGTPRKAFCPPVRWTSFSRRRHSTVVLRGASDTGDRSQFQSTVSFDAGTMIDKVSGAQDECMRERQLYVGLQCILLQTTATPEF
jgi:hypothetical protein